VVAVTMRPIEPSVALVNHSACAAGQPESTASAAVMALWNACRCIRALQASRNATTGHRAPIITAAMPPLLPLVPGEGRGGHA